VTARHRRDFVLDSGAVIAFVANRDVLTGYLTLLETH